MLPRRLRTVPTAATLLLFGALGVLGLGACGGRQISAGVTNVPEASGSGSASTVPDLALATGSAPASAPPPTSATPGALGGSGTGGGAFCRDLAAQLSALPNILGSANTPGRLSLAIQQARLANAKLLRDAPGAIRPDVQTLAGFSNRLFADATASPPKVQDISAVIADPAYRAASANVTRYASTHCSSLVPPTTTP